jgi:curved DNA-binding protein CbpA
MNAFEELGLELDLVIPEGELRRAYDRSSVERHPDAGGTGAAFARLQEAYALLRSPGRRLRHWLELGGTGSGGIGGVPEEMLVVFGQVGGLLQRAEEIRRRKAEARSVLGRSLVEREVMAVTEEIEGMREEVAAKAGGLEERFAEFQERGVEACAGEATLVAGALVFLEKWDGQLREAWVGFAL